LPSIRAIADRGRDGRGDSDLIERRPKWVWRMAAKKCAASGADPSEPVSRLVDVSERMRVLLEDRANVLIGCPENSPEAVELAALADALEAQRQARELAREVKRRKRRPSIDSVAKQAAKAGLAVTGIEYHPDGTVTYLTGKPGPDIGSKANDNQDDDKSPDPYWGDT
jgi:hypothetical protein